MRDPLRHRPFSWIERHGVVEVFFDGRAVTRLRGDAADRFVARVAGLSDADAQQLMASVTGNFKRGNERPPNRL